MSWRRGVVCEKLSRRRQEFGKNYLASKGLRANAKWNAHNDPLLCHFQLLSIINLNNLQTCCFMYKICHCLLPTVFQKLFTLNSNIEDHKTRQSSKIFVISHITSILVHIVYTFMASDYGIC